MGGCFNLGNRFDLGEGGTRDQVEARRLFEKACDGGNVSACRRLETLPDD